MSKHDRTMYTGKGLHKTMDTGRSGSALFLISKMDIDTEETVEAC